MTEPKTRPYRQDRGASVPVEEVSTPLSRAQADLIKQVARRGAREFGRLPAAEAPLIRRTRSAVTGRWSWRLAYNHGFFDDDSGLPTFHAHGPDDKAACRRYFGLIQSIELPNEGSHFCSECLEAIDV